MTSDKDGNYTKAYTYGLDRISVDYLASDETSKRDPLYYLYDGRGSVAQLTNSLGQVKDKYSYDPFGNTNHGGPLGNSEAHFQSFFGFNGEEYNNISGLQYLRARYYESGTGRFLTRDSYLGSLTEPLSLNRYAYTSNNPVMNIDPSGHRRLSMTGDEEYEAAASSRSSSSYGVLRNGSRYGDVSTLQQLLKNAGFSPGTIDGLFGNNTESAVRAYQASKGLAVDGIVGSQTWDSLLPGGTSSSSSSSSSSSLSSEILRKGSRGSAVKKLQQSLIDLGYDLGSYGADEAFGNKTEQAVINFQRDHGLLVDGVVGSQTWGALRDTLNLADRSRRDRCAGTDYIDGQGTGKAGGPTLIEAAEMAAHVYYTKPFEEAKKDLLPGDWKLADVKEQGSMKIGVYARTVGGQTEYVLVNRGTQNWDWSADGDDNAKQLFGKSEDVWNSIDYSKKFIEEHPGANITFVGHSKGGAEAAANAVATSKNAILFNPATVNLGAYDLNSSNYSASMTAYIVEGEILHTLEGWFSVPIGSVEYLPTQHATNTWNPKTNVKNAVENHSMDAVIAAIKKKGWEGKR